jgi:hypothetical protein
MEHLAGLFCKGEPYELIFPSRLPKLDCVESSNKETVKINSKFVRRGLHVPGMPKCGALLVLPPAYRNSLPLIEI